MSARLTRPHLPRVLSLLLALLTQLVAIPATARDDFNVRDVHTHLENGVYLLNATIDAKFSAEALEALENGVPLTIVIHFQVRCVKAWLWEDSLLDQQRRYVIRYKPLADGYEVYPLPGEHGRRFVTREAALRAFGELTDLALINQDRLQPDTDYEVQIKVFLDIEALPLPLRPIAYLKPSWQLASRWSKWPLNR